MDARRALQELYDQHEDELASYPWMDEGARWAELVFCVLHQASDLPPTAVRRGMQLLDGLGLLEVAKVARLADANEDAAAADYVLRQLGLGAERSMAARTTLADLARYLGTAHGGKLQRFLRVHGERIRAELAGSIGTRGLPEREVKTAVTHWLQNALSLPVSLEHPAIQDFCAHHQIKPSDLWSAADDLDLNWALLDDLVELEKAATDEDAAAGRGPDGA